MANYYIVAIRDIRADVYSMPELWIRTEQAVRAFEDRCNDDQARAKKDLVAMHPNDFELILVGEFEDHTGTFLIYEGEDRKQLSVGGINAPKRRGGDLSNAPSTTIDELRDQYGR